MPSPFAAHEEYDKYITSRRLYQLAADVFGGRLILASPVPCVGFSLSLLLTHMCVYICVGVGVEIESGNLCGRVYIYVYIRVDSMMMLQGLDSARARFIAHAARCFACFISFCCVWLLSRDDKRGLDESRN